MFCLRSFIDVVTHVCVYTCDMMLCLGLIVAMKMCSSMSGSLALCVCACVYVLRVRESSRDVCMYLPMYVCE